MVRTDSFGKTSWMLGKIEGGEKRGTIEDEKSLMASPTDI